MYSIGTPGNESAFAAKQATLPNSPTDAEILQAGYRYALAITHHAQDAEDLVHEGWLRLCRRYGRVESCRLLFKTLRNLFIDQYRRRRILIFESIDHDDSPILLEVVGEEPGVKGDLEPLLAILRPNEREMLFLHYHQGHTAEEIAQTTGQPRGTVLSIIHRVIVKMRNAAADEVGPFVTGEPR